MRKISPFIAAPLAIMLGLSGCTSASSVISTVTTDENAIIKNIQNLVAKECAYLPDAASIVALITLINPAVGSWAALVVPVASSICAQVGPVTAARNVNKVIVVHGVTFHGQFIK